MFGKVIRADKEKSDKLENLVTATKRAEKLIKGFEPDRPYRPLG